MVLALPMTIIGQAFEETIREENRMALERERRLKIIVLDRAQKERLKIERGEKRVTPQRQQDIVEVEDRVSTCRNCASLRLQMLPLCTCAQLTGLLLQLNGDIQRLDGEKAEREKYDVDTARVILVNLFNSLLEMTGDDRFSCAVEELTATKDHL